MIYRQNITQSQSVECPFPAHAVLIMNPTGAWVYAAFGSNILPNAPNCDLMIAPYSYIQQSITPTRQFAFAIGSRFLPTATAQGAMIQISFFDTPQSAIIANINTPGAGYNLQWLWVEPVLSSGAIYTVINPGADNRVHLFKLYLMSDPTLTSGYIYFYHSVSPDIITLQWSQQLRQDQIDFIPGGWSLPQGATLKIQNMPTACHPGIGVLYQII